MADTADSGILLLDEHVIGLITDEIQFTDYCAFRATCSHFNKMLWRPVKLTPVECAKRGLRYGFEYLTEHARDVGARNLMQYIGGDFQECRNLWCAHKWKGHKKAVRKYDEWRKFREILDADQETIAKACEKEENIFAALRVGRVEVPRVVHRIIDKLLGFRDVTHNDHIMSTIGNIIVGVETSRRPQFAQELLAKYRRITDTPKFSICVIPKIIREGSVRSCARSFDISAEYASEMMFYAARSGHAHMCRYIARISNDAPIRIANMLEGLARSDSIEVFDLALAWLESRAWCIISEITLQSSMKTDDREYPYIHGIGYSRDLRMERELACYTLELSCVRGSRAIAIRAREWLKRVDATFSIDYSTLFKLAAKKGCYWMSTQIYQWSRDDHAECDVMCLDSGEEYTLARMALRAIDSQKM